MIDRLKQILVAGVFCCVPGALVASEVSTPQQRMKTVELAAALLTPQQAKDSSEDVAARNPFVARRAAQEERSATATGAAPASERELLARIVATFKPSGTISLGDNILLLVGQKRLKVGDVMPIVFQGTPYQVEIVGIDRTSYTLRLNKEEITRPIKSSK